MRRTIPEQTRWIGALAASAALVLAGAGPGTGTGPGAGTGTTKTKKKEPAPPKVEETIGDVASIIGNDFKVEGGGLVIGLDGTGSDPAPSWQRSKLLDEMKKSGIPHPEKILQSKSVTMVTVRATIPAGIGKADFFDSDIELATATATTSLAGGWLISTPLAQRAKTKEGEKDDKVIASAYGPVMIGSRAKPADPKAGRVLGGGHIKEESPYLLSIKEARRSGKTAKLLETVITNRFHQTDGGDQKGMAEAKTDSVLQLRVPKAYHHNQTRYHQLIKLLPLVDNPELRTQRVERWGKELLDPKKSGVAAMRLEGLGVGAALTLRAGLGSPDETVRFFAAESLAYLNDAEGDNAKILADVARNKPEFRSFALKAMAATDVSASLLKLRALMAEPEFELRYGAFDALRTLDPSDPFLGRAMVLDEPTPPEVDEEMALKFATTKVKRPERREEPFALYVVDCEGPPMIHVTRNLRRELVVFGKQQRMITPMVLGSGGTILLNASDGDRTVQISKINEKILDAPRLKADSPLDIAEVVRTLANIGASYPEVVTLMGAAADQKNLPGPLVVDAIPVANKLYDEAQLAGAVLKKDDGLKRTGNREERSSLLDRFQKMIKR